MQSHKSSRKYMESADVVLSKKLCWLLRHGAKKEGLNIQENGFIKVDDILAHRNYNRMFTLDTVKEIVKNDKKQRFALRENAIHGFWEIRANQGHTLKEVKAEDCLHVLSKAEDVPMAVHGTYYRHWPHIKEKGLNRMSRNQVHFATGALASDNISGFRSDCQLLIYLNVRKVLDEGLLKLYRSENGVILCPGLEDGNIPCKYFEKVVDRKTGKSLEF